MGDLDLLGRAKELLDRRTAITMVATTASDGLPEICLLIASNITTDDQLSGGEEEGVSGEIFRNLRREARAHVLVLDPITDPRARDGVRMEVEFLGAEADGEELGRLRHWLQTFAPGRHVIRRLLFKVHKVMPYRPNQGGPILLQ